MLAMGRGSTAADLVAKGTRAVRGRRKHVEKGKVFGARGRGVRHGRQRRRTNDGQGGRARGSVSGANSVELPAMGRESSTQRKGGERQRQERQRKRKGKNARPRSGGEENVNKKLRPPEPEQGPREAEKKKRSLKKTLGKRRVEIWMAQTNPPSLECPSIKLGRLSWREDFISHRWEQQWLTCWRKKERPWGSFNRN